MKIGLVVGMTVGVIGTYALMSKNTTSIERVIKKLARSFKKKYKEIMD